MIFLDFDDGEKVPNKILSYVHNDANTREAYCTIVGIDDNKPIYMLVKCSGYGCQTELFLDGEFHNFGFLFRAREEEAERLCKFVQDNPNAKNLKGVTARIEEFYSAFYNLEKQASDGMEK